VKKRKFFAVAMAAVMTLSMVACGGEQTGNETPTTAPTATTAPTQAPVADPTATPVPEPQNVTIADASITFEDGNMGFVEAYPYHSRSASVELSLVDYNGSKAVKVVNTTGTSKVPYIAIDVSSLFGADVAKIAGVEMVVGASHDDGKFHAVSGEFLSWWGAERDEAELGDWSVYMAKKNPKIITGKVPAGSEFVADANNILILGMTTDNGVDEAKTCGTLYIDDIRFYDAAGNTLKPAATTVAFNWPVMDETDLSIYVLSNAVEFSGYTCSGAGWAQNGADFTQELLDALVPGTALEIDFKSKAGDMWCVFPDATPGGTAAWTRVAQGAAVINDECSKAQITYEQIVAAVGEDKANWGARLQFEASDEWEVYGIRVGKYGKNVSMANPVAFDGYVCSGAGWAQNGADFTQELLDAIVPGTALKVSYKSKAGDMWCVFPDATPGGTAAWTRVAQGQAICDGSTAYITYDQIVAAVGEDKANWGARLQFEASDEWEVYGVEVGKFVEYPVMGKFVDFAGYTCSGAGWAQNGADFTEELLAALTPGSVLEISYKSKAGDMWCVFPDATPGGTAAWTRVAQGQAICTGEKAYITYEQIVAAVGENQAEWGARLQFEASDEWEVYGIRVGKYVVEAKADEGGEETPAATAPDPTIQVADGTVAFTGSKAFADANWWTQVDVSLADLLGGVDPTTVTAIKFTCPDTNFIVGYNDTISGGWAQYDTSNTYVVKTCNFEGTDPIVCLYLSKGDNVEYTITWEVYTGGSTDIIASETPEEPAVVIPDPVITAADGKGSVVGIAKDDWWTQVAITKADLLAGVAAENATTIKLYADTAFAIGYNDATFTWQQADGQTVYEIAANTINWLEEGDNTFYFCVVYRDGDMAEHTINWEVK